MDNNLDIHDLSAKIKHKGRDIFNLKDIVRIFRDVYYFSFFISGMEDFIISDAGRIVI
jgi:hypothetical protein